MFKIFTLEKLISYFKPNSLKISFGKMILQIFAENEMTQNENQLFWNGTTNILFHFIYFFSLKYFLSLFLFCQILIPSNWYFFIKSLFDQQILIQLNN